MNSIVVNSEALYLLALDTNRTLRCSATRTTPKPLTPTYHPHPHHRWGMGGVSDLIHACERKPSIYSNNVLGVRYGRTSSFWKSSSSSLTTPRIGRVTS